MSLLPPNPIVLSKLKYHIMNKVGKDDPLYEQILEKLAPYPMFRLEADFRSTITGKCLSFDDIPKHILCDVAEWDCIDTALNMMTRLKKVLKEMPLEAGFMRIYLKSRDEPTRAWHDLFLDEFPLNIPGLVTEADHR